MTLQSMTGFARSDGSLGAAAWHWEVRSVNNRGLDLRIRTPAGFEALEPKVREGVSKRIVRGSVTVTLSVVRETRPSQVRLNTAALEQVIRTAEQVRARLGGAPPTAEGLLALKGVLEVVEESDDPELIGALHDVMLEGLERALDGVAGARAEEGRRLGVVVAAQVAEIARLTGQIEASPARSPETIKARLKEQVGRLLDSGQSLDPVRLHQEAALIATRADVEEELKRLKAHVEAASTLLGGEMT